MHPHGTVAHAFHQKFPKQGPEPELFSKIWLLKQLCLQCFSPLHTATFKNLQANSVKESKGDCDPLHKLMLMLMLKQLLQCLEDCNASVVCQDQAVTADLCLLCHLI
jgi:hypothetical protein